MGIVRAATYPDIPGIMALLRTCYAESDFGAEGIEFCEDAAKGALVAAIGTMEAKAPMFGTAVFVADDKGEITGIIAGSIQPAYLALQIAIVTDSIWYVDKQKAGPRDGLKLMRALHNWAATSDWRVKAVHYTNDHIGNPARTDTLMRKTGHRLSGGAYEKELKQ